MKNRWYYKYLYLEIQNHKKIGNDDNIFILACKDNITKQWKEGVYERWIQSNFGGGYFSSELCIVTLNQNYNSNTIVNMLQ